MPKKEIRVMEKKAAGFGIGTKAKIIAALAFSLMIICLPVSFAVEIAHDSVSVSDITDSSSKISWTTDIASTGYLEYGTSVGSMLRIPDTSGSATSHSVVLQNLGQGTKYYFQVIAEASDGIDSDGYFDFSTLLSKVSGLKADAVKSGYVELSWNANSKAKSYNIYRNGKKIGSTSLASYKDSSVEPLKAYSYAVAAVDGFGRESEKSDAIELKTPSEPAEISFVQAVDITTNSAKIVWKTDKPADSFVSYGNTPAVGKELYSSSLVTDHSITLSGLEKGVTYYYVVKSGDTASKLSSFSTLAKELNIKIVDINVEQESESSVRLSWKTTEKASSCALYSIDDSFSSERCSQSIALDHSVILANLEPGKTYYYKIRASGIESPVMSFKAGQQQADQKEDFLKLTNVPKESNKAIINITGTARPGAKIMAFVNEQPTAQIIRRLKDAGFSFSISLDSSISKYGSKGKNFVLIKAWDQSGKTDSESFYVVIDTTPPFLEISDIPEQTNKQYINITGRTEKDAAVEAYIDGSRQASAKPDSNGFFSLKLTTGKDGKHKIAVAAKDKIGNVNKIEKEIFVDRTKPKLEITTELKGETHFKLFTIKGKTEPGAKVIAVNSGKLSGCDSPKLRSSYVRCKQFLTKDSYMPEQIQSASGPLSLFYGGEQSAIADSSGNFEITVSLMADTDASAKNKASINNILFFVYDKAGNMNYLRRTIRYKPGCADWHADVGRIQTFPFYLTVKDLRDNNIPATAIIPLTYLGQGVPNIRDILIYKDKSTIGGKLSQLDVFDNTRSNDMVELGSPKISGYDKASNKVVVYLPIEIKKTDRPVDQLPDNIKVYLGARISYKTDSGNSASSKSGTANCDVYWTVSYDLQKEPGNVAKWLSPEMINKSIEFLNNSIAATEKIVDVLNKASRIALLSCGVMIAYEYFSGFFKDPNSKEGKCDARQAEMEKTYYLCDRVLCPAVPPECDSFEPFGDSTKYSATYHAEINGKKQYIQYFVVENGKIKQEDSKSVLVDGKTIEINIQQANKEAKLCNNGILVYYIGEKTESKESNFPLISGSKKLTESGFECIPLTAKEVKNIGGSSSSNLKDYLQEKEYEPKSSSISACYNANCPKFDNTKCFKKADISPTEGLWSSARCLCLPGLKSHLENYLKIMKGAKKCLEQAKIGETSGGYCERLLAQFICDLLIEALKFILNLDSASEFSATHGTARTGLSNYKENAEKISSSLSERYSGIIKDKLHMTSDMLVHKACIFAITMDWSELDGMLNEMVESADIEPVLHTEGSSRAYGYDIFTGRMSIAYDIYVGIVPGGDMDVSVYLECDRSKPGGEMCPDTILKMPLNGFSRRRLSKNDPAINKNVIFVDQNTKWWYNVVVMEANYKLGGKDYHKKIVKEIHKKGQLASGCSFSLVEGIYCKSPEFLNADGNIELISLQLVPEMPGNSYYPGNKVLAMATLDSSVYKDDFFLRVDYTGNKKAPIEYYYPANDDSVHGARKRFLILLDSIDGQTAVDKLSQQSQWAASYKNENIELPAKLELSNAESISAKLTLGLSCSGSKTKNSGKKSQDISYDIKLNKENKKEVILACDDKKFKQACTICSDSSDCKGCSIELKEIAVESLSPLATAASSSVKPQLMLKSTASSGNRESMIIAFSLKQDSGELKKSTSKRIATVSVTADKNKDGKSDSYVSYDTRAQKKELSYNILNKCDASKYPRCKEPYIAIVEPAGDFMPENPKLRFVAQSPSCRVSAVRISLQGNDRATVAGKKGGKIVCLYSITDSDASPVKCEGCNGCDKCCESLSYDSGLNLYTFDIPAQELSKDADSIYYFSVEAFSCKKDKGSSGSGASSSPSGTSLQACETKSLDSCYSKKAVKNSLRFDSKLKNQLCLGSGSCSQWLDAQKAEAEISIVNAGATKTENTGAEANQKTANKETGSSIGAQQTPAASTS